MKKLFDRFRKRIASVTDDAEPSLPRTSVMIYDLTADGVEIREYMGTVWMRLGPTVTVFMERELGEFESEKGLNALGDIADKISGEVDDLLRRKGYDCRNPDPAHQDDRMWVTDTAIS